MMKKILLIATLSLAASVSYAETCQYIGAMKYCDNGYSEQRIGNITFGNDGTTKQRIGNVEFITPGRQQRQQPEYAPKPWGWQR